MNQEKIKQINISVSKIKNWPDSQSQVKFQISFYSKLNGQLIISKFAKGQYALPIKTMNINALMKINYTDDQNIVILRLAYRMGFGGQTILGDFNINLQSLSSKKQIRFFLNQSKTRYLLVEQFQVKSPKLTQQLKAQSESNYGIQKYRNSKNDDFIRQREEFLERHSNRSRTSSNLSTSNNFFSNRVSDLLSQVKNYRESRLKNQQINFKQQNSEQKFSQNYGSRKFNYSQDKDLKKLSQRNMAENGQMLSQRGKSASSQKFVLFVNNLNIVPCEQYYETKIKQVTENKRNRNSVKNQPYSSNKLKTQRQKVGVNRWDPSKFQSQYY